MTRLSINVNKIALIRNARGGNTPNLADAVSHLELHGAHGITVHPRPDERHITYQDCEVLKELVSTEFNIEGYPDERWLEMVCRLKPDQATLVPDPPNALTSDSGWDTLNRKQELIPIIARLKDNGIRVSLFLNPQKELVSHAKDCGADRIELYTGPYAHYYHEIIIGNQLELLKSYQETAIEAANVGLGVNAGHDLNTQNLGYFISQVSNVLEVSIGQAFVSDCLYFGMEETLKRYLKELKYL